MTAPGITLSKLVYQGIKGRSSDKAGEVMGVSSNIPEYNTGQALEEEAMSVLTMLPTANHNQNKHMFRITE